VVLGRLPRGDQSFVEKDWLLPLQEAAVRRRRVKLRYQTAEETTEREVEPLGMAFYGENWYLVAWCLLRNGLRHFRVDRILDVAVLNETFESRPEFSLTDHMRDTVLSEGMATVRIRFAAKVMARVRRETYVTIATEEETPNGVEVSMRTFSVDWMANWILSFAGDAEAIEPEALRRRVRDLAELVFKRHAGEPAVETELA
jgi:predicted DNA-binding transcriptional regulator YafY